MANKECYERCVLEDCQFVINSKCSCPCHQDNQVEGIIREFEESDVWYEIRASDGGLVVNKSRLYSFLRQSINKVLEEKDKEIEELKKKLLGK